MRIVIMSDTHGLHDRIPPVPDGDVLVHAGDLTTIGTLEQVDAALRWLARLPHRHKVIIAGNHDFAFEQQAAAAEAIIPPGINYLRNSGVTIDGIRFWGSPYQPEFFDWAFNLPRGERLARVWANIPQDVQVLVTHGPPFGILDQVNWQPARHEGCEDLRRRVAVLPDLRLHAFGHIHENYGTVEIDGCTYVNASICTLAHQPANAPIVVDL